MRFKASSDIQNSILYLIVLPILGTTFPPACVALMYLLVFIYIGQYNYKTLLFFVCSTIVQNIVLIVAANRFGSTWTTLFSLSKEIMLYGCVLYSAIKMKKTPKYTLLWFLFIVVLMASFLFSDASTYSKFISVRQMLLPFICFYFGKGLYVKNNEMKRIANVIIFASVIVGIIGILELILFKNSIWQSLPMQQYQNNKGTTFQFYNGVPLNYYTWDYYAFFHKPVRRLVSLFGDPLITGHYLFLAFVLSESYIENKTKRRIIQLFLSVCSLLTLSKGIYVAYIIYFFMRLIKRATYRTIKHIFAYIAGGVVLGTAVVFDIASKYMSTSSILIHINGLINGIRSSGFLGNGLGKSGVLVQVLTQADSRLTGESYIGVLVSQMGYIGLILFISFFVAIVFRLIKEYKRNEEMLIYNIATIILTILVESFFSESSIGIVGSGMYFILAGICLTRHKDNEFISFRGKMYEG